MAPVLTREASISASWTEGLCTDQLHSDEHITWKWMAWSWKTYFPLQTGVFRGVPLPLLTNMESENDLLEDYFPLQLLKGPYH